jgi:hypothetical protein
VEGRAQEPPGVAVGVTVGVTGVFVLVAVGLPGVGVGLLLPVTDMPLTFGFSVPVVNWITTWPLLLAVVLNARAMALFWPPADA